MSLEFAIFDDQGNQFGLPARSWPSKEAAESTLGHLRDRRREMEQEAHRAQLELNTHSGWDNETAGREQELKEAVARWDNERSRSYQILVREVTSWEVAL